MKKVLVIQRAIVQYRVDFWNRLKVNLEKHGIELTLLYGKFKNENALKNDEAELEWATFVPNHTYRIANIELNWQTCLPYLKGKDLIIVEQANRNLINYFLHFKRLFSSQKLAYWGHGRNQQINKHSVRNKFKNFFITRCDWWFAYTENVKQYLISNSFQEDKITCVQNAIDTISLSESYENISGTSIKSLKSKLGISSNRVGIFCGGIYKEKRIDFLLEACDKIKKKIPDFHMIVIGSGTEADKIVKAAKIRPWVHYLGSIFNLEKVRYFKIASVYMMPGLVGLGVLDSFALETPLVTTDYLYHSPEIEYLENGANGLITEDDIDAYVAAVIEIMKNEKIRQQLVEGCRRSSAKYTLEQMVDNFTSGIINCLEYK